MADRTRARSEAETRVEGLLAVLRTRGHRVTTPRRLLLRSLVEVGGHRTAEELAAAVQAEAPDVHLSTIYRNLDELEQLGVIEHAHLGHGAAAYQLTEDPHSHLVCAGCGATLEVPDTLFHPLVQRALADYSFHVDPHHDALVGRCEDCAAEQ